MKTLTIILGQARAHELTWFNFKKNLLDTTNSDLALCIGESIDNNDSNPFWKNAKYKWEFKEYEDFGDGFDLYFKNLKNYNPNWRSILEVKDQWLGGVLGPNAHPGSAGILIFYRWVLLLKLKEFGLDKLYDKFIITRSDYFWELKHPNLNDLDNDKMWFPLGEQYGGYTDRHVVLTKTYLEDYLTLLEPIMSNTDELYSDMSNHHNAGSWNLEKYIKYHLTQRGLIQKIAFFPFCMYSVRMETTHTRWSKGNYNNKLGFYLKYPDEYIRTKITKKLLYKNGNVKLLKPNSFFVLALNLIYKINNKIRLIKP